MEESVARESARSPPLSLFKIGVIRPTVTGRKQSHIAVNCPLSISQTDATMFNVEATAVDGVHNGLQAAEATSLATLARLLKT